MADHHRGRLALEILAQALLGRHLLVLQQVDEFPGSFRRVGDDKLRGNSSF